MDWDTNIAYAIGLIATDGNLSKDRRHIIFVSKDLKQVKVFKKCLKLKNKISFKTSGYSNKKGKYYFIQFGNKKFYNQLVDIGLRPAKSKNIGRLEINQEYFADFLRGHLDGDGTIKVYRDSIYKKNQRLYITFMSASKPHLVWLQVQVRKLYGVVGRMRAVPRAWVLVYAKNESKQLIKIIYYKNQLPYLKRKKRLIEHYCDNQIKRRW